MRMNVPVYLVCRKSSWAADWETVGEFSKPERAAAIAAFNALPRSEFCALFYCPYGRDGIANLRFRFYPPELVPLAAFLGGLKNLVNIVDPGMQIIRHEARATEE